MSKPTKDRPETVGGKDLKGMYTYLDELRKSGVTNMFGSPLYLIEDFELSREDAKQVFKFWMEDFSRDG